MFAMSGPPATAIAGRMALIERFASPYFDQGELAAVLAALETFPPVDYSRLVVSVADDDNPLAELVQAFLAELQVPAKVERRQFGRGRKAKALRWLGDKLPRLPELAPLSALMIDLADASLMGRQLEALGPRLIPGGLLFIDDLSDEVPETRRVIDGFLARHPDFEVLLRSYYLVARRRQAAAPIRLEQVNLCLNYNACNLRCPACWTVYSRDLPAKTGKPTYVSWDKLERFLASPGLERMTVVVIGGGEPLLYPPIDQFLKTAPTGERRMMMMSNATLLHTKPTFWEVAQHARLTLSVSLDAARPETYAFVRQPAKWDVTRKNIERFARLRDETNPHLELQTSFVVLRHNVDEIVEFMHLNKEWGSTYVHFHPALSAGFPEEWRLSPGDPRLVAQLEEAMAFGKEHGIALDPPEHLMSPSSLMPGVQAEPSPVPDGGVDPRKTCQDYRKQVAIDVAGETFVCDTAFRIGYSLGNAYEQPIDALWNGARWQSLRQAHARGTQLQHPLCKHCVMGSC